jgi:hypothetical protein
VKKDVRGGPKGSPNQGHHHPRKTQITHDHTSTGQKGTKCVQGPWRAGSCTASPLRSRVSTPSSEVPPHSRLSIPSSEFLPRSRGSAPPRANIKLFHARGRPSTDDVAHPLRSTRALNALICCGMPKSKANRLPHHATGIAWDSARLSLGTVRPNPITVWLTPVVVQVLCGPIRTGRRHSTALCF